MIAVASFTATFTTIAVYLWWRAHGRDDYEDIEAWWLRIGGFLLLFGGNFGGFLMREMQQDVFFLGGGRVFFLGGRGN